MRCGVKTPVDYGQTGATALFAAAFFFLGLEVLGVVVAAAGCARVGVGVWVLLRLLVGAVVFGFVLVYG